MNDTKFLSGCCAALLLSVLTFNSGAACLNPPSGLVSWWSGDDTATDLRGLNHGAQRFGASYTNGRVGRAFSFDGVSNYVQTTTWGMNVGYGDFSIIGWVRTTATNDYNTVVTLDTAAPGVYITGTNGALRLYPAPGTTNGGFNDGQFHHFAVTRLNGGLSYFKDGVLVGTNLYGDYINRTRFQIGSDGNWPFRGAIDEVAFFDRALNISDVQAIYAAGADGMCKPATLPAQQFFIEAEDFDFNSGQHRAEADAMPYLGGAYAGLSATAEIDYHDPGANEYADYRPASQGVALIPNGDTYRDSYALVSNYKVAYCDPGDWFNYTRVFPAPARSYRIYARLSSGALPNAIQLDEVTAGFGTSNQALVKIGRALGPAPGGWDTFNYVPVTDDFGQPVIVNYSGQKTIRVTILPGGNEDFNYLAFVPVDSSTSSNCVASASGLAAWWSGDGHSFDLQGTNHGALRNGATFTAGKAGEGFVFDGFNDYVETALDVQPGALTNTTWECWVFPMQADGYRRQILSCDDGGYDRSVLMEVGYFGIFVGWGVWYPVGSTPNQWQHIAVVFTTNNVEFYKNGVRFSYNSAPAGQPTANRLQIGRNPGFGEYFQGRIDEVGIYNRGLSAPEIQSIYNAGAGGRCKSVAPCPNIALSPSSLSAATAGANYSQVLTASGGAAPYVFTLADGTLPPMLTLSSNGLLSGSLVSTGNFSFSVRATDVNGCSKAQSYLLAVSPPTPPCTNLPPGLVSWWRAESNANDSVGLNAGVPTPGTSYTTGKVGQTFQFFGTNWITVHTNGLNVGTNDFSVEGWIKTSSLADYSTIFAYNYYNPGIYIRGGGQLQLYPAGASSSNGFNDGQFHHFAVVRQGPNIAYFKDGASAGAVTYSPPMNLNEQNIYIGTDPYPTRFNGDIDELSFYNRALSSNEVQAIFAAGSLGKCAGQGTGGGTPDIALLATNLNFGTVTISNSADLTLTVANVGTSTLTIASLATNHSAFRVVSPVPPFNVATGAQAVITLRFTPTNAAAVTGAVSIVSNDPDEGMVNVLLTGSGTAVPSSPPIIASITPANPAPGSLVTITGTNFGTSASATTVYFGSHVAVIQSINSTQIVVRLPSALGGQVSVSVFVNGLVSDPFEFQIQSPPSSLRITESSLTPMDFLRLLTEPVWPNPSELLLESADSLAGPWWKELDVQRSSAPGGYEFLTPRRTHYAQRFFRVGAFASRTLPFIRYITPNDFVRPGLSVTLLGANFDPNPSGNFVLFELPGQSWAANVTQAATNVLVVTVPPNLLTRGSSTGVLYQVRVTTSLGTGNGVGCTVYQTTANTFMLRPQEAYIDQPPGSGRTTLVLGGGVPPYRLVPQTTGELAVAVATLNGLTLDVVAQTNRQFGSITIRVEDSSAPPQQSYANVGLLSLPFGPSFSGAFHSLVGGSTPGLTMNIEIAPSAQALRVETVELRLQNAGVEVSRLYPGKVLGLIKLFYSSTTYGFQHLAVTEVLPGRAKFNVISLSSGAERVVAQGEMIESPPAVVMNVLNLKPASHFPQPVHQELVFADDIFRLPPAAGETFSMTAKFTSVSVLEDAYLPQHHTETNFFTNAPGLAPTAPRIDRLVPVQGEVGRIVRLRGANFAASASENAVTFAGLGGSRVPAQVTSVTNNELTLRVPRDAVSGPVRVSVAGNTGNDFSFFVRFHPDALLLFNSGLTSNVPTAPNFIHQQAQDEAETIGEVPIQFVNYTLDTGRLSVTGLTSNQQVGTAYVINTYTGRTSTNTIVYSGQEPLPLQRHMFEVRVSSFLLSRIYAHDNPTNGVTFRVESPDGIFQFNPGAVWDYQFSAPIYRPTAGSGGEVTVRAHVISRPWTSIPGNQMYRFIDSAYPVQ